MKDSAFTMGEYEVTESSSSTAITMMSSCTLALRHKCPQGCTVILLVETAPKEDMSSSA